MPFGDELYSNISSFEPLLPRSGRDVLAGLTCQILLEAGKLEAHLPSPDVRNRIVGLVRTMNSYYSNLIEGHKTYPREIEEAMSNSFSKDEKSRENQFLARAHRETEDLMLVRMESEPGIEIRSPEFVCWLHREFYSRLPEELRVGYRRNGTTYPLSAGDYRTFEVDVGHHQPPHWASIPRFMERWGAFYKSGQILETNQLVALSAAHQRLAWIHPFGDGNGRVARLHTEAWLRTSGVGSLGLWTISRGLARQRQEYYDRLNAADQTRQGDLDGRGNLSDSGLARFCVFFLETMLDQIRFMSSLLQLNVLGRRIEAHLHVAYPEWKTAKRDQVARLLKATLVEGAYPRGAVAQLLGVSSATASGVIRLALKEGLIDSPESSRGPVLPVFDSRTLESYFPKLYQDLPV